MKHLDRRLRLVPQPRDVGAEERLDKALDHVRPLARGGTNARVNLQPAHPSCNIKKGAAWAGHA